MPRILIASDDEFARELIGRLRPEGLRRPVVYVLSWQQCEQTVLALLECGVDQYLTFPVSLQRLRAKVVSDLAVNGL